MSTIHPTAVVDPGAQLGADVTIGPYAVIEDAVIIGDRCRVESHAVIKRFTRMGTDNRIHSHALVGGEPQDLKFHGETTWLELGDNNNVREFSTLHRGTEGGGGLTRVGSRNLIMAYAHVAHDCTLGDDIVMSNGATLGGHVSVGDFAIIGGLSAVHQFCQIGTHAFVGGMTGVPQNLPPWMLAAGSRALVHGPNMVGLRRAGASRALVLAFKQAFRLIWRSETPRAEALELLTHEYASMQQVLDFVDFVRKSERGICPAEKNNEKTLDDNAVTG
ncbi:MAG: acyl-ACP--UDP-N-acetylglucosamine O-acyltransferase [Bilophila sp.]